MIFSSPPNIQMNRAHYYSTFMQNATRGEKINLSNVVKWPQGSLHVWKTVADLVTTKRARDANFTNMINNNRYNEIMDKIFIDDLKMTRQQALKLYNKLLNEGHMFLHVQPFGWAPYQIPVNEVTKDWFITFLSQGYVATKQQTFGSDTLDTFDIEDIEYVEVAKLPPPTKEVANKSGGFFPYINTSPIPLSEYQIYNQKEAYDVKMIKKREHCLIVALDRQGVDKATQNTIKLQHTTGCNIAKKHLKQIADLTNRSVVLHFIDKRSKVKKQLFKAESPSGEPLINLAIHSNHYFSHETTAYTMFSAKNIEKIKHLDNYQDITSMNARGGKPKRKANPKRITSLRLVHILHELGLFKKLDLSLFPEANHSAVTRNHVHMDQIATEQRLIKVKKDKPVEERPIIYFADTETYVHKKETNHKLQLIGWVSNSEPSVHIYHTEEAKNARFVDEEIKAKNIAYKWLNDITSNGTHDAICYFHNLKYDYNVLKLFLPITDQCVKDGQRYSVELVYKRKKISLRCSYKLLAIPLSKFNSTFSLKDGKKDAISYDYYTPENYNKRCKTSEYSSRLSKSEQKIFAENMLTEPSYNSDDDTFNPTQYYRDYLRLDVDVLKQGLNKFNELIKQITGGMEIWDTLTISSLTHKYMMNQGAYKDVFEVTGNLRKFISSAVMGGRVCANKKYAKQVVEEKIADYDGVSLYPSAIYRLCQESGLPTGPAKTLVDLTKWDKYHYSVVEILITKVNKKQQMPFIAHRSEGSIQYLNEPPEGPIVVDKITLEDYIKFHKIEYEVIRGVYWDGVPNPKMGEVTGKMFQERLKCKKAGNKALSNAIKLMLNSTYGKTVTKTAKVKHRIMKNSKMVKNKKTGRWTEQKTSTLDNYIYNNFNTIMSYQNINTNIYEIKEITSDQSFNQAHVGCMILSYSKRIMNEVFDVANTNNLPIYYQDTDSMHLKYDDVEILETKYEQEYGRQLTGKQLGQFHIDFDLDGAGKGEEIYATKSIFLGKKSYIDCLESKDANGNTINGYHIRLKGITKEGIEDTAKRSIFTEDCAPNYWKMFEYLASGKPLSVTLNPFNKETNKQKALFEYTKNGVQTRKEFTRIIQF